MARTAQTSAAVDSVAFTFAGGSPSAVAFTHPELGGDAGYTPAHPTESRAGGRTRLVGRRIDFTVPIKKGQAIVAYKRLYVREADDDQILPEVTDNTWGAAVGVLDGGSLDYAVEARAGADTLPRYRRQSVAGTLEVALLTTAHAALSALDGETVDIAMERIDGTFRILLGVTIDYAPYGASGDDRTQVATLHIDGSDFGYNTLANEFNPSTETGIKRLYDAMMAVESADVTFAHLDGSTMKVEDARFVVHVTESFGAAETATILVEGAGYAATNAVATLSPAL